MKAKKEEEKKKAKDRAKRNIKKKSAKGKNSAKRNNTNRESRLAISRTVRLRPMRRPTERRTPQMHPPQDLATASASIDPIETVEFISKPGGMTLYSGVTSELTEGMKPYDSVVFSRPALMKLVSYDSDALDWNGLLSSGVADED